MSYKRLWLFRSVIDFLTNNDQDWLIRDINDVGFVKPGI